MAAKGDGDSKPFGRDDPKRRGVKLPPGWAPVARHLAQINQKPLSWYLVSLILADAERRKLKGLPPPPWAAGGDGGDEADAPDE